jgi:hypothetical protein
MCHPREGGDLYEEIASPEIPAGLFLCVYEKPQAYARGKFFLRSFDFACGSAQDDTVVLAFQPEVHGGERRKLYA